MYCDVRVEIVKVKIVCISDTHGEHEAVKPPDGDVLVHAGDITAHGSRADFHSFVDWLAAQPHEHKVFIAGNHDTFLEKQPEHVNEVVQQKGLHYLCDSGVHIDGVKFWGSPITPRFHDWSFMREPGDIDQHWSLIPDDTQILITHGPVWGVLDEVRRSAELTENTGCPMLAKRIKKIQPAYHVFGHIHEGYGELESNATRFINVSTMNESYKIQNKPVVFDID